MYFGLAVSFFMHAGILAWAVYSIQVTDKLPEPEAPTIEAQLITTAEFTSLRQGDPNSQKMDAKEKDKPDPKVSKKKAPKAKPKVARELPAAPPQPSEEDKKKLEEKLKAEAAKAAEAKRKAEEKKKAEAEAKKKAEEEKKKAEAKKRAEEKKRKAAERKRKERARKKKLAEEKKRKEREKKKKFDADRIAALLDKTPEKRGAPDSPSRKPEKPTDYKGPTAGEREGTGTLLTAREADLLKGRISSQLRSCWRLPGGGGGIDNVVVTLKWRLKPDGSLNGLPKVERPRNDPVFRIAAEAAVRAVTQCAPFRLPPDKYKAWQTIIWDFDPRQML